MHTAKKLKETAVINYTLIFYTRKAFFDLEEPKNVTENFADFTQCVLRAKELMYEERDRLEGKCFPDFNCLIEWKNPSDMDKCCLRCDYDLWGYNFVRAGGYAHGEQEHLQKLNDIWEDR